MNPAWDVRKATLSASPVPTRGCMDPAHRQPLPGAAETHPRGRSVFEIADLVEMTLPRRPGRAVVAWLDLYRRRGTMRATASARTTRPRQEPPTGETPPRPR